MSQLLDLDNESFVPNSAGSTRIRTAGIHSNLKLASIDLIDKAPDPQKGKKGWIACEIVFENENGEQHKELFMEPIKDASRVDPSKTMKWYDTVNGKKMNTRKCTVEEHIKIKNNEFAFFLIDLGTALGYSPDSIKDTLKKATSFKQLVEQFKKHFPATEKTRINVRLLWQNDDSYQKSDGSMSKAQSWLKVYYTGMFTMYYPYGDRAFEKYEEGKNPMLSISDFAVKRGCMVEKYPYVRAEGPATNDPIVAGSAAINNAGNPYAGGAAKSDVDPF